MKTLDRTWIKKFVDESNLIDPQPGFANKPGSPRWDDHLAALNTAIALGHEKKLADPLEIHRQLMGRMWPAIAGQTRMVNVRVATEIFPPYQVVPKMLAAWSNRTTSQFVDGREKLMLIPKAERLARLWLTHVQFERIHPFRDGNGRTGRILMVNHSLLLGVEPPLVKYQDRFEYYERFA